MKEKQLKPIKEEPSHVAKGYVHGGTRSKCIICSGKAPGVLGEKTGGKWG